MNLKKPFHKIYVRNYLSALKQNIQTTKKKRKRKEFHREISQTKIKTN